MTLIRKATVSDAHAIRDIWNPILRDTLITFSTVEKSEQDIVAMISQTELPVFVAERDGRVVGWARYAPFRDGPGYRFTMEHSIQLAPDAQGGGIGRKIMTVLEAEARSNAVHSLIAGISGVNQAAMDFHAAIGFVEVGRLPETGFKQDRWLDLVLMQKILRMQPDSYCAGR